MSDDQQPALGGQPFEDMKRTNEHGAEYWSARDIQPLLGYDQWRRFENAVKKAQTSCEQSGNDCDHHFAGAGKMVELGSGSERNLADYHLSRFACYLIAQNGDPRKPEIAHAQRYFAIQARRQELSDTHAADVESIECWKAASLTRLWSYGVNPSLTLPARKSRRGGPDLGCDRAGGKPPATKREQALALQRVGAIQSPFAPVRATG